MVTQNTIVGGSSIGGQLQQGFKIQIYGKRAMQTAVSTLSGYLQDWGPCCRLYSHLRSGAHQGNYNPVKDIAFARDSD